VSAAGGVLGSESWKNMDVAIGWNGSHCNKLSPLAIPVAQLGDERRPICHGRDPDVVAFHTRKRSLTPALTA
jgi:hypothetical protein